MDREEKKNEIAIERYGKNFEDCDTNEKRGVGGVIGNLVKTGEIEGGRGAKTPTSPKASTKKASTKSPKSQKEPASTQEERDEYAQEHFGKDYSELDTHEKRVISGHIGADHRAANRA